MASSRVPSQHPLGDSRVGALSVWVSVLSSTSKLAIAVLAVVVTVGAVLHVRRRLQR